MTRRFRALWAIAGLVALGCGSTDDDAKDDPGFVCELSQVCAPFQTTPAGLAASPEVTCYLESLRDRVVGRYGYSVASYATSHVTVWVLSDGTAAVETKTFHDTGETDESPPTHVALRDAAYFDDCLAATTDQERFTCTMNGIGDVLTTEMSCP
jgi:hypothetical protein